MPRGRGGKKKRNSRGRLSEAEREEKDRRQEAFLRAERESLARSSGGLRRVSMDRGTSIESVDSSSSEEGAATAPAMEMDEEELEHRVVDMLRKRLAAKVTDRLQRGQKIGRVAKNGEVYVDIRPPQLNRESGNWESLHLSFHLWSRERPSAIHLSRVTHDAPVGPRDKYPRQIKDEWLAVYETTDGSTWHWSLLPSGLTSDTLGRHTSFRLMRTLRNNQNIDFQQDYKTNQRRLWQEAYRAMGGAAPDPMKDYAIREVEFNLLKYWINELASATAVPRVYDPATLPSARLLASHGMDEAMWLKCSSALRGKLLIYLGLFENDNENSQGLRW